MNETGNGTGSAAGSLLARALEPGSSAREPHPHQPSHCLNCQTELVGAYCHACGQQAHLHRTIGGFLHDLLHGALHFEGKIWRTLPMLAFRPGMLTRRYVEGARARFVSPMALFLFSVFLMFAVFHAVGITTPMEIRGDRAVAGSIVELRELWESEVQAAQARLDATAPDHPSRAALEEELSEARGNLAQLDEISRAAIEHDGEDGLNISTGVDYLDNTLIAKWRENPGLMLYKLQANSYKFSWLLIPLSIPFVWLLFAWKRRFAGYDHAIFATVAPIHLAAQVRGAYGLSRFSTGWRVAVMIVFIAIILVLFLQILLLLGAF